MAISEVAPVYLFETLNPISRWKKFYPFFHDTFIFATNNFPLLERDDDFFSDRNFEAFETLRNRELFIKRKQSNQS